MFVYCIPYIVHSELFKLLWIYKVNCVTCKIFLIFTLPIWHLGFSVTYPGLIPSISMDLLWLQPWCTPQIYLVQYSNCFNLAIKNHAVLLLYFCPKGKLSCHSGIQDQGSEKTRSKSYPRPNRSFTSFFSSLLCQEQFEDFSVNWHWAKN